MRRLVTGWCQMSRPIQTSRMQAFYACKCLDEFTFGLSSCTPSPDSLPGSSSRILVEILLRAEKHLPVGPTGFTSSSCLKRGSDDSFIPVPSCSSSFGRPPGSLDAWFALVRCHLSCLFFARYKDTIICSKQILYCTCI